MDCRGFPHHPHSTSPGHRVQLPSLNSHKNQFLGVLPCLPHFTVDVARASRIHRVCEGQCSPCPTQVTDVTKPAQNLRPSRPNPSPGATPHARLTLKRIRLLLRALLLSQLLAPLLDFLIPVDDVLLGETKMRGSPPSPSRSWQKTSSQRATMGKTLGTALDQASVFPTPSLGSSGGARKIQVRAGAKPVPPSPSCSSWETPKSLEMPPKCSHWSPRKENQPAALSSASARCVMGEDHFWNTDLTTNSAWTPHIQTGHPKFSLDIHQGHREVLSYRRANSLTCRNSTVLSGSLVPMYRKVSLWNLLWRCFWISSSSKLLNLQTEQANWILNTAMAARVTDELERWGTSSAAQERREDRDRSPRPPQFSTSSIPYCPI